MARRRQVALAFAIAAVFGSSVGGALRVGSQEPATRPATATEAAFCVANYDQLGPINGDCTTVVLAGDIQEDDPWGRWDCRTMGNHVCGSAKGPIIHFNLGGELHGFELNAPNRPACRVEPSNTREGFEVIFYMDQAKADQAGFEVRCPL